MGHAEQFDEFAAYEPRRACLADTLGELRDELLPLVWVEKRGKWRQAKPRYPVGSTLSTQVERMFPFNHEYWIRFTGGVSQNWSGVLLP